VHRTLPVRHYEAGNSLQGMIARRQTIAETYNRLPGRNNCLINRCGGSETIDRDANNRRKTIA
jgi:hypothetical protein